MILKIVKTAQLFNKKLNIIKTSSKFLKGEVNLKVFLSFKIVFLERLTLVTIQVSKKKKSFVSFFEKR